MKLANLVLAVLFGVFGAALYGGAAALPPGGNLPGPGFFPKTIAVVMMLVAAGLLVQTFRAKTAPGAFSWGDRRTVGGAALLIALFLALWGTGYFAVRAAVFLMLLLLLVGEPWKRGAAVSVILAAVVSLAFQVGLRISLE